MRPTHTPPANQAPSAQDQAENDADRAITRRIRQSVVSDDRLGTAAKNVTIVTIGGDVTLRGPVGSARERDIVVAIARRTEGVQRLDDRLEVQN